MGAVDMVLSYSSELVKRARNPVLSGFLPKFCH